MKTLAAALITALLVFTLATGWSELVQPRLELMALAAAANGPDGAAKSLNKRSSRRTISDEDEEVLDDAADEVPVKPRTKTVRVSKRSRSDSLASEPTKERLIEQLAEVKQKESNLVAREETLRMLYDDIRTELASVEETRKRSAAALATADRRPSASRTGVVGSADAVNQPMASTKPKITPESRIAGVIQDLASQGNLTAAALLLNGMKDREVAKVLTSLSVRDPRLALRLSDQVQASKQPPLRR